MTFPGFFKRLIRGGITEALRPGASDEDQPPEDASVQLSILVAPDGFKDACTADEAAAAIGEGLRRALPAAHIDLCPIADGGEGTVNAIVRATGGRFRASTVTGPRADLGMTVEARWGTFMDNHARRTAVIELAQAGGLELLDGEQRDPTRTTTFGVGQVVAEVLDAGIRQVVVGIGGSATTDAGCGAAQALGVRFHDASGALIDEPITGGMLERIARIDTSQRHPALAEATLRIACDVTNPLHGPRGAAHVYAPQKGADAEQVERLDAGLEHVAGLWREQLGSAVGALPDEEAMRSGTYEGAGAGAAGGFGGGAVAMLGGTLEPGIDLVLELVEFEERLRGKNLLVTGEGKLDGQTASGKAIAGVLKYADRYRLRTVALVGCVGEGADVLLGRGLTSYEVIGDGLTPEESIARTRDLLADAAERLADRLYRRQYDRSANLHPLDRRASRGRRAQRGAKHG